MEVRLESIGIERKDKIITISSLNPIVSYLGEKVIDVCRKLSESGHRSLPVVDKKLQLKGIVTITDIFSLLISENDIKLPVENIMSREVVFCDANEIIEYVLQKMKISKRGRLPVTLGNKVVSIISETDFILSTKDFSIFDNIEISEVMIRKPFFITSSFSVKDAVKTMVNGKYRRLPVVDSGILIGYVTSTLLLKVIVENSFSEEIWGKNISEVMRKNPIVVKYSEKLSEVLKKMREKSISSMLVVNEEGKLEGIFTERDYVNILV